MILIMTTLTGASDDLIELDGDITEEFARYNSKGDYLAFSDGTVLLARYEGIWKFSLLYRGDKFEAKDEGCLDEDTNDVVMFKDGLKWVIVGPEIARSSKKNV